jgi:hypothetical protein
MAENSITCILYVYFMKISEFAEKLLYWIRNSRVTRSHISCLFIDDFRNDPISSIDCITSNDIDIELERWKKAVVVSFEILSRQLPGGTEEIRDKPKPRQSVSGPRSESIISRIRNVRSNHSEATFAASPLK